MFIRLDLLAILEGAAGTRAREQSDIVEDFWRRLRRIENEVQSFREVSPDRWSANARMGFFMALQDGFRRADWRYVANKGGGMYAFYWCGGPETDGCKPYLQVEAAPGRLALCFRSTPSAKRTAARYASAGIEM